MTTTMTPETASTATGSDLLDHAQAALRACGARVPEAQGGGATWTARSPIDGSSLLTLRADSAADVEAAIGAAHEAFLEWRTVPGPSAARSSSAWADSSKSTRATSPTS